MVSNFQWAVRAFADCENNMAYYERLHEYQNDLVEEAPKKLDFSPPSSWPSQGSFLLVVYKY
jgi:hypothetical protein